MRQARFLLVATDPGPLQTHKDVHVELDGFTEDQQQFMRKLAGNGFRFSPLDRDDEPMYLEENSSREEVFAFFERVHLERELRLDTDRSDLEEMLKLDIKELLQEGFFLPFEHPHKYAEALHPLIHELETQALHALLLDLWDKDHHHRSWIRQHGSDHLKTQLALLPPGSLFISTEQDVEWGMEVFQSQWEVDQNLYLQYLQERLALEHPGWHYMDFADTSPLKNPSPVLQKVARKEHVKPQMLLNPADLCLPEALKKRLRGRKKVPVVAVSWREGDRVYLQFPEEETTKPTRPAKAGGPRAYQMRVKLLDVTPSVWRTFQVNGTLALHELHTVLQIVMGWEDYHLYDFQHEGQLYGRGGGGQSAYGITLDSLNLSRGSGLYYQYDFGDMWEHMVQVEKVFQPDPEQFYPVCLKGGGKCPEEDCGGPHAHMWRMKRRKKKPFVFPVQQVNAQLQRRFKSNQEPSSPGH